MSNAVPVTPAQDSSRHNIVTPNKPAKLQPVSANKLDESQPVNEVISTIGKKKKVKR